MSKDITIKDFKRITSLCYLVFFVFWCSLTAMKYSVLFLIIVLVLTVLFYFHCCCLAVKKHIITKKMVLYYNALMLLSNIFLTIGTNFYIENNGQLSSCAWFNIILGIILLILHFCSMPKGSTKPEG